MIEGVQHSMNETDDTAVLDADDAPAGRHTSSSLFGEYGLNVMTFDEYETPFDPMAAIDGD